MSGEDPHVALAAAYVDDVLSGRLPACRFVVQACRRQRDDLARFAGDDSPFYFDAAAAGRPCRFIELLPHIKGPRASAHETVRLEPWQCFVLTTVFGWRRRDTGGRRFRRAYIEVPRGNAKSTTSSGVALYAFAGEGEEGAEVYAAATTRAQAKIVWGVSRAMLKRKPEFARRLGVHIGKEVLTQGKTNSTYAPMTRDPNTNEGQNTHLAVVDELHAHQTRELYDVIETSASKRPSSLIWVITTAGDDTAGICYEIRSYCRSVLAGDAVDETQFAVIYGVDEGTTVDAMLTDETVWRAANPNWGVSVDVENFRALAAKALEVPSARSNFLRKHLDVWVRGDETWMDIEAWDRLGDPALERDAFVGVRCDVGIDLATKNDLACKALLFSRMLPVLFPDGLPEFETDPKTGELRQKYERHFYLFVDSYLPAAAATASRNAMYSGWVERGHIKTTPGDVLDFDVIKNDVRGDASRYSIHQVGFDPWQATQLSQELLAEQIPMVEVRPTTANFSAPMKELAALVAQGRLHHDGNELVRWCLTNTVCSRDSRENFYPRKERYELRIDAVVASLIALNRALTHEPPPDETASPYETRGIRTL